MTSTAIDWASKPPPWNRIGRAWAAEVQEICGRVKAPKAEKLPDITGTKLQARMIRGKLKAAVLADRVGCSHSMIKALIAGTTTASQGLWERIDAALTAAEHKQGRA